MRPICLVFAPLVLAGCEEVTDKLSVRVLICVALLVLWLCIERMIALQKAAVLTLEEIRDLLYEQTHPDLDSGDS